MRKYCPNCHSHHEPGSAHRFSAINNTPAINMHAINTANGETPLDQPLIPVAQVKACVGVDGPERRTPNRRDRADYNAYMKGYMQRRRAEKHA